MNLKLKVIIKSGLQMLQNLDMATTEKKAYLSAILDLGVLHIVLAIVITISLFLILLDNL